MPKILPTPAVSASANAPQKVTRTAARKTPAPPAFAPMAPSSAKHPREAAETMGMIASRGAIPTTRSGSAAPAAKVTAEVKAACTGRALAFHSIRVNKQWRLIFQWDGAKGEASGVYLDNHSYQ